MPVVIVVALETVDVDHEQSQGLPVTGTAFHDSHQTALHPASVMQPGERIGQGVAFLDTLPYTALHQCPVVSAHPHREDM
jgi:hypothetical protein